MAHYYKATGALLRAALSDREHARDAAEAFLRLPEVVNERRALPAHVERALAVLESH
jgi:hypothetical protein